MTDKLPATAAEALDRLERVAIAFDPVEGPPNVQEWTEIRSAIFALASLVREQNAAEQAMIEALGNSPWIVECDTKISAGVVTTTRKEFREQRYVVDGWEAMLDAAPKGNEEKP